MADTRAFVQKIEPNGAGVNENNAVHQTSPAWVLSFIRWSNRDTFRNDTISPTATRDVLVVESDCIQLSVTSNKATLTPQLNAVLVMTDIDYETAIAPGDFVIANMLNWEEDARDVATRARTKQAINNEDDGFKGIFKVQGVRRRLLTDPATGAVTVLFTLTAYAFTEFNNTIYFNPYLIDQNQDPKNQLLFSSYIGRDWTKLVNDKGLINVQDLISLLIQSFIGDGVTDAGRYEKNSILKSPNVHFYMPSAVGTLLGLTGVKAAKDIYNYIFGIQKYSSGANQTLAAGMNPSGLSMQYNRIYYTPSPCGGQSLLKPEFWNQVKTWSILNQYTNSPLNELYTSFRISPNGKVLPTLTLRQIPFTNEDFTGSTAAVTKFMNLPRWKINQALILEKDIGRDEAARVNFVQYFGRSTVGVNGADIAVEIAKGNYAYDIGDVQRSGLRPYIVTTQFDEITDENKEYHSPSWAQIVGDAVIGGHLKMNGTIICAGIVDPIAVGDNLQDDNIVYHIEQITHTAQITPDGKKSFRTTLSLSNGLDINSSTAGTQYAEMATPNAYDARIADWLQKQILPGVSESQDVPDRTGVLDKVKTGTSKPFAQPGDNTSTNFEDDSHE